MGQHSTLERMLSPASPAQQTGKLGLTGATARPPLSKGAAKLVVTAAGVSPAHGAARWTVDSWSAPHEHPCAALVEWSAYGGLDCCSVFPSLVTHCNHPRTRMGLSPRSRPKLVATGGNVGVSQSGLVVSHAHARTHTHLCGHLADELLLVCQLGVAPDQRDHDLWVDLNARLGGVHRCLKDGSDLARQVRVAERTKELQRRAGGLGEGGREERALSGFREHVRHPPKVRATKTVCGSMTLTGLTHFDAWQERALDPFPLFECLCNLQCEGRMSRSSLYITHTLL